MAILGPLGVPVGHLRSRHTKGMVVDEVTAYWHERHPWAGPGVEEVARRIDDEVERLVVSEAEVRPGAQPALEEARRLGLALALASSSRYRYVEAVLDRFGLRRYFEVVHSAEDEDHGKPDPAVFLGAAARLGVVPEACVVFEDSPAGVLAAKAARMACIAVPADEDRQDPAITQADAILSSLEALGPAVWARLGLHV